MQKPLKAQHGLGKDIKPVCLDHFRKQRKCDGEQAGEIGWGRLHNVSMGRSVSVREGTGELSARKLLLWLLTGEWIVIR